MRGINYKKIYPIIILSYGYPPIRMCWFSTKIEVKNKYNNITTVKHIRWQTYITILIKNEWIMIQP